jgi:diguanylate cyclase (GGDEF)-like protein
VLEVGGAVLTVGLVGLLDFAIGLSFRLYPLYIPPIALTTWRVGTFAGVAVAITSVASWALSHWLAGEIFSPAAWIVNSLAHTTAFLTIIGLISSLKARHAAERLLARTDALTGLENARSFLETASAELTRQRRTRRPLSIAYLDLDNFKYVNDRHGHLVGDTVLARVADALRSSTRTTDTLSRMGGDEFAVLMPETDVNGARAVLERVQAEINREMAAHGWPVACSVGAVVFQEPARDVDELIRLADNLMYEVKQAGKNAFRVREHVAGESSAQEADRIAARR